MDADKESCVDEDRSCSAASSSATSGILHGSSSVCAQLDVWHLNLITIISRACGASVEHCVFLGSDSISY